MDTPDMFDRILAILREEAPEALDAAMEKLRAEPPGLNAYEVGQRVQQYIRDALPLVVSPIDSDTAIADVKAGIGVAPEWLYGGAVGGVMSDLKPSCVHQGVRYEAQGQTVTATPLNAQRLTALNASDLIKAGVLCVPESGELPDPAVVGTTLIACVSVSDGGNFWTSAHFIKGNWYSEDCDIGEAFECWMLPPVLGK